MSPFISAAFTHMYKVRNLTPTPIETLENARELGLSVGLEYVYIGNVPGHKGESAYCPHCKKMVIGRRGYFILANNMEKGRCKFCGKDIPGIWQGTS